MTLNTRMNCKEPAIFLNLFHAVKMKTVIATVN